MIAKTMLQSGECEERTFSFILSKRSFACLINTVIHSGEREKRMLSWYAKGNFSEFMDKC